MGYSRQAIIGISWMSAFRILSRIIAFARIIILARILVPAQFGVFGIATMALVLLEMLTETGVNVFLIQEKKGIKDYVNDAWLISIVRGILISLLIAISAPFVADFFNISGSLGILLLISVVPFVKGFINPSEVVFQKELQFSKEFWFRTVIFTLDSSVAVIVSLITKSAIGLVSGLIAGALLEVILSFVLIKPTPSFKFNISTFMKIFHKGKWVTMYGILNYASTQGDSAVIGKLLGAGSLGTYQLGRTIATMPVSEVADVANKVTFPVYSKISGDIDRLRKGFIKTTLAATLFTLILGIIIFFFPKELFILIFGFKWLDALIVFKPLALYAVVRSISNTAFSLFFALGKQKYVAAITFSRFLGLAVTITPLTAAYGIMGAGYSILISGIIESIPTIYFASRVFKKT